MYELLVEAKKKLKATRKSRRKIFFGNDPKIQLCRSLHSDKVKALVSCAKPKTLNANHLHNHKRPAF